MQANIEAFFDTTTGTITYVVFDEQGGHAALIDPVLQYDQKSGRTRTTGADKIIAFVRSANLTVDWILETHAHADHLSAAYYLKQQLGGKLAIGENIRAVQKIFKKVFNLESTFQADGTQFDHLLTDGEIVQVGKLEGRALFVPGHTPADMAYVFGNVVFVGDTMFMPDVGSARCDFPGGSAQALYQSVHKLLSLPDDTRLFMCHDYPPPSRAPRWESSVREQREHNIHVNEKISEAEFASMRNARDATLELPVLMLPSIQINIRAGALPPPENNGVSYVKIPLNRL